MTVVGLAVRSLRQRALATVLTSFGVALGVGLFVFVSSVRHASRTAFDDAARGYDVVVSGKGTSSFSAVMNAIFHVDQPQDTVSVAAYEAIRKDPRVAHAVPFAVGDVFRGFRVVATTSEFFDAIPDSRGKPLRERLRAGSRLIKDTGEFEAIVGARVASRTGLGIGSTFTVTHGLEQGAEHEHDDEWAVVGALEPTGTPNDRAIFITLESFFHVKGHEPPAAPAMADSPPAPVGGSGLPSDVWAVSTVIVRLKSPAFRFQFASDWNRHAVHTNVRASVPSQQINDWFEKVQFAEGLLRFVALLVLASAGLSTLAALYNSIHGRRREIAILRALGARRAHVVSVVVIEAVLTCLLGGAMGLALGHVGVSAAAPWLLDTVGIRVGAGEADLALYGRLLAGLVGLGVVAGALPAWRAYCVPVARNLSAD